MHPLTAATGNEAVRFSHVDVIPHSSDLYMPHPAKASAVLQNQAATTALILQQSLCPVQAFALDTVSKLGGISADAHRSQWLIVEEGLQLMILQGNLQRIRSQLALGDSIVQPEVTLHTATPL